MPYCQNCGHHVTPDYVRVMGVSSDEAEFCPHCPDKVERGGRARQARGKTRGAVQ